MVKDVFLPWYNAYRFLVQNVLRLQQQSGVTFEPTKVTPPWPSLLLLSTECLVVSQTAPKLCHACCSALTLHSCAFACCPDHLCLHQVAPWRWSLAVQVDVSKASNVLDRWINAASRTLTSFVTEEMDAYRLYTVVPVLVKFINNLTNIYVRYNRRRLKGSKGTEDTLMALVSLYDVLLTVCKVSRPLFIAWPLCWLIILRSAHAQAVRQALLMQISDHQVM